MTDQTGVLVEAADQWADEFMQAHQGSMPRGLEHAELAIWFDRAIELNKAEIEKPWREALERIVNAWDHVRVSHEAADSWPLALDEARALLSGFTGRGRG